MSHLLLGIIGVVLFLWLVTMPRRRRRRRERADRIRGKAHNSKRIRYVGFPNSVDDKGRRMVHTVEKDGANSCSDSCVHCQRGAEYQENNLRVFDDRPIRGRKQRRRVLRGEDE